MSSAGASEAATSGSDSGAAGTSGEPPLTVTAVDLWGGQALGMVPYATSGTRLAAIGYADGDAVFFKTMRDTQLGFDCTFE